jgi:glycosyltransferase involved in cell wall biosynthesis
VPLKQKIKVLQLTANLGIGGLERVVVNLCKYLDKKNFDVHACCIRFKGEFATELEEDGIPVHLVPQVTSRPDYLAFTRLAKIINKIKPHVIHSHNTNSFIDSTLATMFTHVPVKVNTDHARNFPGRYRELLLESICARFADKFIAVSEETRQNLIRYEKIPRDKIVIINNGIDGKKFDRNIDIEEKKKSLGLSDFSPIVGLGVRLTAQKGIKHLIAAAPQVIEKFPNICFFIAGKGGLKNTLIQKTEQLGVSHHFKFPGPRLDLFEILKILDLYVLPSEWEGLPLSLLETMAAGCPIVATNVGGIPKAIEDGISGVLVEAKNSGQLANGIIRILSNKELGAQLSQNAKKRFLKEFSAERMVAEHEALYRKLLMRKGIIEEWER